MSVNLHQICDTDSPQVVDNKTMNISTLFIKGGSVGQLLQTDGNGNLSFVTAGSGSVTSIGILGDSSNIIVVSNSPITGAGNIQLEVNSGNILAGNSLLLEGKSWQVPDNIGYTTPAKLNTTHIDVSGMTQAMQIANNTRIGTFDSSLGSVDLMYCDSSDNIQIADGYITINDDTGNASSAALWQNLAQDRLHIYGTSSGSVQIKPASSGANYILIMPATTGTFGQVLVTDGSGNLSWASAPAASNATLLDNSNWSSPAPIGTVLPNTGHFSQITVDNSAVFSQGIRGLTGGNSQPAGTIGEVIFSQKSSMGISLSNGSIAQVTSINLTAGDWDVYGTVDFNCSSLVFTGLLGGASSSNSTNAETDACMIDLVGGTTGSGLMVKPFPTSRYLLSSPTTIYLIARATFSGGSVTALGTIYARRSG